MNYKSFHFLVLMLFVAGFNGYSSQPMLLINAHKGPVAALACSPDGNSVISSSTDETMKMWNLFSGKELLTFEVFEGTVKDLSYSPDGHFVAGTNGSPQFSVWSVNNGSVFKQFEGHTAPVTSISFSSNGKNLASASEDKTIRIWEMFTGSNTITMTGHTAGINKISYSHDGKSLVSVSTDKTIRIWDCRTGSQKMLIKMNKQEIQMIAFTPDDKYVVGCDQKNIIRIWEANSGNQLISYTIQSGEISDFCISPDGKYIICTTGQHSMKIWDLLKGGNIMTLKTADHSAGPVTFRPKGRFFISGSDDGFLSIWDVDALFEDKTNILLQNNEDLVLAQNTRNYRIKAKIWSKSEVSKIQIFVNNQLQTERLFPTKAGNNEILIDESLLLQNDSNLVRILVKDESILLASDSMMICRKLSDRLALVIGNADYLTGPLRNPVNDARDMANLLDSMGFDVMKYENLKDRFETEKAIIDFGQQLKNYKIGLFYYAGHGMQVDGTNYLIPTRVRLNSEDVIKNYCTDASMVLTEMEVAGSKLNIVILDACRDNPFSRSLAGLQKEKGLAFMQGFDGTFIAYSTSPGSVASDGSGDNGLYTSELLTYLPLSGLKLEELFKLVGAGVKLKSSNRQVPWVSSSFTGDFYFRD